MCPFQSFRHRCGISAHLEGVLTRFCQRLTAISVASIISYDSTRTLIPTKLLPCLVMPHQKSKKSVFVYTFANISPVSPLKMKPLEEDNENPVGMDYRE